MAGGVGVLSSESRAKSVAVTKSNSESLNIELTRDTQKGRLGKHIFLIIYELLIKRDRSEVVKMIISFNIILLLLFVLFRLLTLSGILRSFLIFSFLFLILHGLDLRV